MRLLWLSAVGGFFLAAAVVALASDVSSSQPGTITYLEKLDTNAFAGSLYRLSEERQK